MKVKTIVTLLAIILTVLCHAEPSFTVKNENGIRIVTNQNRAADSTFRCGVKLVAELTKEKVEQYKLLDLVREVGGKVVYDVDADSKGNFYLITTNKVIKLNPKLEYITQWGKIGSGPGEFRAALGLFIYNDTVFVQNQNTAELLRFNTDGKYIYKSFTGYKSDLACMNFNGISSNLKNGFIAPVRSHYNSHPRGEIFYYNDQVIEFNPKLKRNRVLYERRKDCTESDYFYFLAASSQKEFAVVENDFNAYLINVYNLNGKLTTKIRRGFKKIENPDKAITYSEADTKQGTVKIKDTPAKFLEPISKIFYDQYGRLWVLAKGEPNQKNFISFDVFMNGILMKKVTIPRNGKDWFGVWIIKDKMIVMDKTTLEMDLYEIY